MLHVIIETETKGQTLRANLGDVIFEVRQSPALPLIEVQNPILVRKTKEITKEKEPTSSSGNDAEDTNIIYHGSSTEFVIV